MKKAKLASQFPLPADFEVEEARLGTRYSLKSIHLFEYTYMTRSIGVESASNRASMSSILLTLKKKKKIYKTTTSNISIFTRTF